MTVNTDLDLLIMEQHINKIKEQAITVIVNRSIQSGNHTIINISLYSGVDISSYYENIVVAVEIQDFVKNTVTTQEFNINGDLFNDEILNDILLLRDVNDTDSSIGAYVKSANLIFL